jgi:adenylyltransferase/sulfurtransferase
MHALEEVPMRIAFTYYAQVRALAGADTEDLEVAEGAPLAAALEACALKHGDEFRRLVLTDEGTPRPSILVLVNGQPSAGNLGRELWAGDSISLLSAVAGG